MCITIIIKKYVFLFFNLLFFDLAIPINDSLFLLFKQGKTYRIHSEFDQMLTILFPGICSKLLDCIIRYVDSNVRFSTLLEECRLTIFPEFNCFRCIAGNNVVVIC